MRSRRFGWTALTAFALLGCMAGTGTDTENGVYVSAHVVTATGAPVANVNVSIHDLSTRADSTVTSPHYEEGASLKTDPNGRVYFYLKKNGVYMASGKRGDSVVFIDTLRMRGQGGGTPVHGLGHPEFQVETPVRATGTVRFHSGLVPDSGRVMLRGTRINTTFSDSGVYNLGWLPPSSEKTLLTVTYQGTSRDTRYVKVTTQGVQLTVHGSTRDGHCLADSTDPVSPALSLTLDGSLARTEDVARLVGKACAVQVGAVVRVLETDTAGKVIGERGSYVIPSPDASTPWDQLRTDMTGAAVPAGCIETESNLTAGLTGRATLRLAHGEILVNDFRNAGTGCLD